MEITDKTNRSLIELFLVAIRNDQKRLVVAEWLDQKNWKTILGTIDQETIPEEEKTDLISSFSIMVDNFTNEDTLYFHFIKKIRQMAAERFNSIHGPFEPGDTEINLIFSLEDLKLFLKKNLYQVFPSQTMEIKNRFLRYNLVGIEQRYANFNEFAFSVFSTSFFYYSNIQDNVPTSQKIRGLGSKELRRFLKTGRFGKKHSDLVILTFDKKILMENNTIFFQPSWMSKVLVRDQTPEKFQELNHRLIQHQLKIGVAKSTTFTIKALKGVDIFETC